MNTIPVLSLNKVRAGSVTCPECGARQLSAVTSYDWRQGNMVRVTFDCGHGRIVAKIAEGKKKA